MIVSPVAFACWCERRLSPGTESIFTFWTHVFAMLPGLPGLFLRRAFYRWTLERCAEDVTIEFGALFSRPGTVLESRVYIGPYAMIGSAWIQEGCLIGSRASLLSGGHQHELLPDGRWSPTVAGALQRIVIGANTWIGEGAIMLAGTGPGCMISAGAVVTSAAPPHTMLAGNPARFVRRLTSEAETPLPREDSAATVVS